MKEPASIFNAPTRASGRTQHYRRNRTLARVRAVFVLRAAPAPPMIPNSNRRDAWLKALNEDSRNRQSRTGDVFRGYLASFSSPTYIKRPPMMSRIAPKIGHPVSKESAPPITRADPAARNPLPSPLEPLQPEFTNHSTPLRRPARSRPAHSETPHVAEGPRIAEGYICCSPSGLSFSI